jgi:uncharacterized repeat protein (TIGR02543 family)
LKKISALAIVFTLIIVPFQVTSIQVKPAQAQIPTYYLFVNIVGSGSITYNGTGVYDSGQVVNLTAYAAAGWEFTGWSGDLTGTTNPAYLTMDSNKTVTATFTKIPNTIESCDVSGVKKDTFVISDKVYATGTGYQPQTTYDIYVVEDVMWVDGMAIPPRVPGTTATVTADGDGTVPPTLLWSNPLVPGKYDIIVDVDGDGLYYSDSDALDDNDIEVTAGFFVIPELPIGTILATLSMFAALIGYVRFKRYRTK